MTTYITIEYRTSPEGVDFNLYLSLSCVKTSYVTGGIEHMVYIFLFRYRCVFFVSFLYPRLEENVTYRIVIFHYKNIPLISRGEFCLFTNRFI